MLHVSLILKVHIFTKFRLRVSVQLFSFIYQSINQSLFAQICNKMTIVVQSTP